MYKSSENALCIWKKHQYVLCDHPPLSTFDQNGWLCHPLKANTLTKMLLFIPRPSYTFLLPKGKRLITAQSSVR